MSITQYRLSQGSDLPLKALAKKAKLQKSRLQIQTRRLELKKELVFGGDSQ